MADNSTMGGSTDVIRDKDRSGVKTQVFGLDVGIGTGTEALMSSSNPLPSYDPDVTTTGTVAMSGTTNAVTATLNGDAVVGFAISGTWTGTLSYEATINGTDWFSINAGANATGTISTTATANGQGQCFVAGIASFRIRCSVAGTGTASITVIASAGSGLSKMVTPLPAGTNTIGAVKKPASTTGTITSPALSTSSFTVLASNTSRLGATFYNDSSVILYLALASTASTTAFTCQVPPGGYYELPNDTCGYTGIVTGIALTATGNVRVTELT